MFKIFLLLKFNFENFLVSTFDTRVFILLHQKMIHANLNLINLITKKFKLFILKKFNKIPK